MKNITFFLIFGINICFSQHENELLKKDSIFIVFNASDNEKIYTRLVNEETKELRRIMYKFFFDNGDNCSFVHYKSFNYDEKGNEILKTYKLKKSFLRKNKHKIITYEEINEKGFVNYIDFLTERKVYIIDLAEAKGRHLIARGVIFSFVGKE